MNHRRYRLHTVVAILLLASVVRAQTAKVKGPDYSVKGGEYSVLNNLMMYGDAHFPCKCTKELL